MEDVNINKIKTILNYVDCRNIEKIFYFCNKSSYVITMHIYDILMIQNICSLSQPTLVF